MVVILTLLKAYPPKHADSSAVGRWLTRYTSTTDASYTIRPSRIAFPSDTSPLRPMAWSAASSMLCIAGKFPSSC